MYESCSNRNLFGVVRSRRTGRSDTSPLCKRFARTRRCKRSPTSVRCHGELYDRTVQLEDTRKILGVSDVTKIIVFRNTEGGTTAFDKTFSTIRSRFLSTRSFSPPPFSAILVSLRCTPAVARKCVTSGTKGTGIGATAQRRNRATP